jgi:hypothetical protein
MKIKSAEEVEKLFTNIREQNSDEYKVMFISGVYSTGKQSFYAVDLSE